MLRQFLVVLVFQNGVFSFRNDKSLDSMVPTSSLLKLINKVIQNEKDDNLRYKTIEDRDATNIDLDYYDFNNNYYKKEEEDLSSDLLREDEEDIPREKEVRIHVIENPEVIEQYQNILYFKRHPSGKKPKLLPKIYKSLTLEDIISHLRRNSAARLDTLSSENNKQKGDGYNNDKIRQRSQNLNLNNKKKQNTFGDDLVEPKTGNDDWDVTAKKYKENKRENRSKEIIKNTNIDTNIEWGNKKETYNVEKKISPNWDDDYQTKGKKSRVKDDRESNYRPFKETGDNFKDSKLDSKPKSDGSYKKTSYKQLKFENHPEANYKPKAFNYRPLRLSEHFKPHYKPFNSDEKKHSKNERNVYRAPMKQNKPAYKETNFQPKISKNVESNYDSYRDRKSVV